MTKILSETLLASGPRTTRFLLCEKQTGSSSIAIRIRSVSWKKSKEVVVVQDFGTVHAGAVNQIVAHLSKVASF